MSQMVFRNYGGIFQLRLESADDLAQLRALAPARWAATSAPIDAFRCDPKVLKLMDSGNTGRVRTQDFVGAQEWLFKRLANRERMVSGSDRLRLADIDTSHPEGELLKRAAELTLKQLNAAGAEELSLQQVQAFDKTFAAAFPNGDGIVPLEFIEDVEVRAYIQDIIKITSGVMDQANKPGFGKVHLVDFQKRTQVALNWLAQGHVDADGVACRPELWPLGKETADAVAFVFGLNQKVELFFKQCELVRLDQRALNYLKISDDTFKKLNTNDGKALTASMLAAPLAAPNTEGVLDLTGAVNPLFEDRVRKLAGIIEQHASEGDPGSITQSEWRKLKSLLAPHKAWLDAKPNDPIVGLGEEKLKAYHSGPLPEKAQALIQKDMDVAKELQQISGLEQLILFQKWLMRLANNFVSFSHLYDPAHEALFERGTLVIDGRALAFTMRVADRKAHKKSASSSSMFLVYCEVTAGEQAKGPKEKFDLVAAVTAGEVGGIALGKRGLYIDVKGAEWDAKVVDLLVNPISLWEAVRAPFEKVGNMVAKKVEDLASKEVASLEKATDVGMKKMDAAKGTKGAKGKAAKPAPVKAAPTTTAKAAGGSSSSMRDLLMGGGFAFAAVGSSLAFILKTVSEIDPVHFVAAVFGMLFVVIFFSGLLGYLKLRKRDMSALLEASGWAVNYRMKLTNRLGKIFTRKPAIPVEAIKEVKDVFGDYVHRAGEKDYTGKRIVLGLMLGLVLAFVIFWRYYPMAINRMVDWVLSPF